MRLVIHSPFMAHQTLKVLFAGKLRLGDIFNKVIDERSWGLMIYCAIVANDCFET
jgi:hypothetical protein